MWRRSRRDRWEDHNDDTGLADECEAFLAGRLGAFLQEAGRPVPPVAWLNEVAHATPEELAELAASAPPPTFHPSSWRRTVGYLSRSLLERARETGRDIDTLQRQFLVPLELELIGRPESAGLDPADVIRITLTRLYELPDRSA